MVAKQLSIFLENKSGRLTEAVSYTHLLGLSIKCLMYSTARVNVFPEPAEALYTNNSM